MKTILLSVLMIAFILIPTLPDAKSAVHIVDNSSVSPGVFTTINAAVAAASNGDTLYIQPSGLTYTDATISKQLHIVGPGHTPAYTTTVPLINIVVFSTGSNGSTLEGVAINSSVTINSDVIDITIRYSRFFSQGVLNYINCVSNNHNLVIEGNVFHNYGFAYAIINLNQNTQNTLIKNNYFRINSVYTSVSILSGVNASTIFDHNTVVVIPNGSYCNNCQAHQVSNNIWIGATNNISSGAGASMFLNNLTFSTTATYTDLPGEDNLNNTQPVFENAVSPYEWSVDSDFSLTDSSPGYSGSLGGSQIGMYGGSFDFRKRGQPGGIPTFDQVLILNNNVPQNGILQIRVKAQKGKE